MDRETKVADVPRNVQIVIFDILTGPRGLDGDAEAGKDPSFLDFGPSRIGVFECWSELCVGGGHCRLNRCGACNRIYQRWSRFPP